eukprot:CAMPEP_0182880132 /NCGR_PEP_ID=MMETSP0034_2-20130328/16386_1 /TAXON_ID=156128 /ORGANISM="Nephroselmis pyriformis, Strain CCMP717" /LENGTH=69 /DNA_ID=CAMNT_0025013105 /DNA_START=72 /DNA_END=284 /DNA_ORIENTATION=+
MRAAKDPPAASWGTALGSGAPAASIPDLTSSSGSSIRIPSPPYSSPPAASCSAAGWWRAVAVTASLHST